MGQGIFITGSDTGVGKTLVGCALASWLKGLGYRVGVMKPVETGCREGGGELFPRDAFDLKRASGCEESLERICPYRFREPLAPSVAAQRADAEIDISLVCRLYEEIASAHDLTLVEGAGGLLVPLLPHFTYADLAGALSLRLVVVAANRLGAINHLLLTLEHASCRGLRVLGYILNDVEDPPSLAAETNAAALRHLAPSRCLAEIPHLEGGMALGTEKLASVIRERIDPAFLAAVLRPG